MASKKLGTLYIGVTSDLLRRVYQHREGMIDGFTNQHGCKRLVWFEQTSEMAVAIAREKQIKNWKRSWKISLVEEENPMWADLYPSLAGMDSGSSPE